MTQTIKKKSILIGEIMKLTKAGEDKFDQINDKSEQYLTKLIKVIKNAL